MEKIIGVNQHTETMRNIEKNIVPMLLKFDLVNRLAFLDLRGCNSSFVEGVAFEVAKTGKHVNDLTVKEMHRIIENCNKNYETDKNK